jgi:hypothetical protein
MKLEQVSTDLSSRLVDMAQVAHDSSLSTAERSEKLNQMKGVTLEKIASESGEVSILAQSILDNIQYIVENEDWAKLPPPVNLSSNLAAAASVTSELQSLATKVLPDIQAMQRVYVETMLKLLQTNSNSEVLSMNHQWASANTQFAKSKLAAEEEKTSGIVSGAVGIATASASIVAKGVVTGLTKKKFDRNAPSSEENAELKKTKDLHLETGKELKKEKAKLDQLKLEVAKNEQEIRNLKTQKNTSQLSRDEISIREAVVKDSKSRISIAENKLTNIKADHELASAGLSAINSSIDFKAGSANRFAQEMRAYNDITDQGANLLQSAGKLGTSFVDASAKEHRIESEKASFMTNFANSVQQTAQKERRDILDGINSSTSMLTAVNQGYDSSNTHIIRSA